MFIYPTASYVTSRVARASGGCRPDEGVFTLLLVLAVNLALWWLILCIVLSGKGRSSGNVLFETSGGINAIALIMTVKDSATITAAAERAAGAAAETLPFNFLTSRCTCICRA